MTEQRRGGRQRALTPRRREKFLDALAEGATISDAAALSGVSRRTVYSEKDRDGEFAKAWETAMARGDDAIEDEIRRRGMQGYDEPVRYQGEVVGYTRRYSDILLLALANKRIAGFRTDNRVNVNIGVQRSERTPDADLARQMMFAAELRLKAALRAHPELLGAYTESELRRRFVADTAQRYGIPIADSEESALGRLSAPEPVAFDATQALPVQDAAPEYPSSPEEVVENASDEGRVKYDTTHYPSREEMGTGK